MWVNPSLAQGLPSSVDVDAFRKYTDRLIDILTIANILTSTLVNKQLIYRTIYDSIDIFI